MKKLTLDLDALRVESFDTDADAREQGTVHAHAEIGAENTDRTCKVSCPYGSCVTCYIPTDPCICDPFEPATD